MFVREAKDIAPVVVCGVCSVFFQKPHNVRTGYTYMRTNVMTRRMLSEAEGFELLKEHGIPVPEFTVVRTRQEMADAAARYRLPSGDEGHLSPNRS